MIRNLSETLITTAKEQELAMTQEPFFLISPDYRHFASIRKSPAGQFILLDTTPYRTYEKITSFDFSPDSSRTAYAVRAGKQSYINADRDRYGLYEWTGVIKFSPDSRLLTFGARAENHDMIVVNGQEGKGYDTLYGLKFDSPNQFHYIVRRDSEFLVVDETIEIE